MEKSLNFHEPAPLVYIILTLTWQRDKYDLFLFPSGGENYGHVIAESLSSGTPVLISKNTPWLDLESQNLGWDIDLKDMDSFVEIIEKVARMSHDERQDKQNNIRKIIKDIFNISLTI